LLADLCNLIGDFGSTFPTGKSFCAKLFGESYTGFPFVYLFLDADLFFLGFLSSIYVSSFLTGFSRLGRVFWPYAFALLPFPFYFPATRCGSISFISMS